MADEPSIRFVRDWKVSQQFPETERIKRAREEGRREILAEVAKIGRDHINDRGYCIFCEGDNIKRDEPHHQPDCLWLRAQAVTTQPV